MSIDGIHHLQTGFSEEMSHYIIAYDIQSPARWRKVHRVLCARAVPIQYSVFLLTGDKRSFKQCKDKLLQLIHPTLDDIRFYPLPKRGFKFQYGRPAIPEGIYLSDFPNFPKFATIEKDLDL